MCRCWASYKEKQINALDPTQNKAAKFARLKNDLNWETSAQLRKIARICALFKAYTGERAWKAISDRLQKPPSLISVDYDKKIKSRNKRQMSENIPF
jgi:hypothetical protein